MKVLVSIHDVTPAHDAAVRTLDALCAARGVTPALLVVPNWHGRWPLQRHPAFVHWVRSRVEAGAELLLHGERHDEAGLTRGIADHVRAIGRTAREGEFLTLDARAASARIYRGLDVLGRVGLVPIGFVAPAWLWRVDTRTAVARAGLQVSEDDAAIYLHDRGVAIPSPVLRWSARSGWRAHASVLVARARVRGARRHAVVRVALHPNDLRHSATRRSLEETLDAMLALGTSRGYGTL